MTALALATRIVAAVQEHPFVCSVSGRKADREALVLEIAAQLERFRKDALDEAASKVAHAFRDLCQSHQRAEVEAERAEA